MSLASLRRQLFARLLRRDAVKHGGLLMLANGIVLALALVRTPAITWLLPKDQVGMMGVVASWLPFVQLLSLSGMDTASYHYVAKGKPAAFIVNIAYRLRWSLLSSGAFALGAAYWGWQGQGALAWLFVVAATSYPLTIGLTAAGSMLAAQERFVALFWYRLWESLTDFAGFLPLLLALVWVNQVVTFYATNQIATALMLVGLTLWIVRGLRQAQVAPLAAEDEAEMVRYGRHQTVINSIGVVQSRTDALLIGTFLPLTVMADYSIALLIYEQFKRLWSVYLSVRYPVLVRMALPRRRRRLLREGALVWIAFGAMGIAVAFVARLFIPLVLPASYVGSLGFADWLVAAFVASTPGFLAEAYFRTEQDERNQYRLRATSAVFGVLLPAAFIVPFGAYGVVVGRFIAGVVLSVTGLWLFRRAHPPAA